MLEIEPSGQHGRTATGMAETGGAYRFTAIGVILT